MNEKKLSAIFEAFRISCEERLALRAPNDLRGIAHDEGAAAAYEHAREVSWLMEQD